MNKNSLRILSLPERFRNSLLFLFFRFDKWHISPSGNRMYPKDIISYCNSLKNRTTVCEIGCGLADTLSKIKAKKRIGFDRDRNVLKAATWLHRKRLNLEFDYFSFPETKLKTSFDILIAVNWLHNIDNQTIQAVFTDYFNKHLTDQGVLIVDAVNHPNYLYYHNFAEYFADINCTIHEIGSYQSNRKLIAIHKTSK